MPVPQVIEMGSDRAFETRKVYVQDIPWAQRWEVAWRVVTTGVFEIECVKEIKASPASAL